MKKGKILTLIMCCSLAGTMVGNGVLAVAKTQQEINSEIEENNKKIEELEKEKNKVNEEKSTAKNKLEDIQEQVNKQNKLLTETRTEIKGFENEINSLQGEIDGLNKKVDEIKVKINDNKLEISKKQEEIDKKQDILDERLRYSYMNNVGDKMIYMLIDSKGLGDLISNISNIGTILKTDKKLIKEVEESKQDLIAKENSLKAKENELNKNIEGIESKKSEVENAKSKVQELESVYATEAAKLASIESERQSEYDKLSSEEKAIQTEIAQYNQDNADLRAYFNNLSKSNTTENNSNNAGSSSSGSGSGSSSNEGGATAPSSQGFIKPASGGITSPYGPRVHPVTGKQSFHTGVDYGASYGSAIKASKSGTVTTAGWHTAYGKMVIIDHGNGQSTLYAHSSQLNVSVGQKVSQGQVIAQVGSTGYSTGPHLHFEIRINGQHQNPTKYV
ncbi:murein hydrolase activator EnvC family protein [Clostridium massiliamazoniense]|uniref:murein hydrolase activator EnvC family protein n=1 Tax=Clostridium massiliamazoniense TaxID=1347366 RepID=UPI0006D84481|nr:M23 family metallopeptidase [Clostridium massiliamazoniense]